MASKNNCKNGPYDSQNNTCFTTEQLLEMAKAYNRHISKNNLHPDRINGTNIYLYIKIDGDKKYLLDTLRDRFKTQCSNGDDQCLTQQEFMKDIVREMYTDISNEIYRPSGPKGSTTWLSTSDIDGIMNAYQNKYHDFKFLGAVPLDCDEYAFCSLFSIDFSDANIKQYGVIFNLDRHGQPGSHWVALYINSETGEVCFCDSMGNKPMGNILNVIDKFSKYYKDKTGKNITLKTNSNRYQTDGSECGVYSCNFLIRKLSGESFDDIVSHSLNFSGINSCRNVYFNNHPSKFEPNELCDPANPISQDK